MRAKQQQSTAELQDDFRMLALPASQSSLDTDEYQNVPIDTSASEYNEPLVDLASHGIASKSFFARTDRLNAPIGKPLHFALKQVYARAGIADKLVQVNRILSRYGVELLVLDGFRPVAVQAELWSWISEEAKRALPGANSDTCTRWALRWCSNPARFNVSDPTTWPTHATGGAVDVTLRELVSRNPLHMGGIYLDPSDISATRFYEQHSRDNSLSDNVARQNRRLLFWAMRQVGFVNYPFEWWHFDYLTQAWVMNQGNTSGLQAHYGLANRGEALTE